MSQWGLWADDLDEIALEQLARAYLTRKRFEAELQAGWIVRVLGEAMNGKQGETSVQRVAPQDMLNMMGVSLG